MIPFQEVYEYVGVAPEPVSKNRAQIMRDLRDIAVEVNLTTGTPWQAISEYQRRMNAYMSSHGIVFYQP